MTPKETCMPKVHPWWFWRKYKCWINFTWHFGCLCRCCLSLLDPSVSWSVGLWLMLEDKHCPFQNIPYHFLFGSVWQLPSLLTQGLVSTFLLHLLRLHCSNCRLHRNIYIIHFPGASDLWLINSTHVRTVEPLCHLLIMSLSEGLLIIANRRAQTHCAGSGEEHTVGGQKASQLCRCMTLMHCGSFLPTVLCVVQ